MVSGALSGVLPECDDWIGQHADVLDLYIDGVARFQEDLRVARHADAGTLAAAGPTLSPTPATHAGGQPVQGRLPFWPRRCRVLPLPR